jgi:4-aminobutyrate aminotransferase-like enzyme
MLKKGRVGAVLVEPIQGRGGMRVPPAGFLDLLRQLCNDYGALLLLDEIYTGFGRTGRWFACEHEGVVPDVICLGKGLTGGFPLSACVGRADLMDAAWPASAGEAIHTSTFLGHPVGCAMALAEIAELRQCQLIRQSERQGQYLLEKLQAWAREHSVVREVRGRGLMLGIEFNSAANLAAGDLCLRLVQRLLRAGFIVLPDGAQCEVLALTPPFIVTRPQIDRLLRALDVVLRAELAVA